jgi:SHS2 domain-containing protein
MVKGPRDGEIQWLPLDIDGADWSELLVALLNEVVFQADGQGLITTALKVRELGRDRLIARLGVIPLNENHRWVEPVKAVTYHQAMVEQQGNRWRGEVLMDV